MTSAGNALRTLVCECPMLTRMSLLSRQWTGWTKNGNTIGLGAARTIKRILRPRGCKAGQRHKKVCPIQPVINVFGPRKPTSSEHINCDRTPKTLSHIQSISSQATKLQLNAGLWNARSLRNKVAALTSSIIDNKLDLYVITETWAKTDSDPIVGEISSSLKGYSFYHRPRKGRRGGGAAIIARSGLNVKIKQPQDFTSFEYIDASVRSRDQLIQLIAVYRPPFSGKNKSTMTTFLTEFGTFLEDVLTRSGRLLMLGDFNFHWETESLDTLKFADLISSMGLKQHVQGPTHDRGHTLDLVITRLECNIVSSVTINRLLPSDHAEILLELRVVKPANKKSIIKQRNLSNVDWDLLKSKLAPLQSMVNFQNQDVSTLLDTYSSVVLTALDELAPVKEKTIVDRPNAPWYDVKLSDARKVLRRAERGMKSGLEIHRQMFRSAREHYTQLVDDAKTIYYRDRIAEADTKKLFVIVDGMINNKRAIASKLPTNIPSEKLPNAFSDFFTDKVMKLRNSISPQPLPPDEKCDFKLENFLSFSSKDLRRIILDTAKKSCALDILPTKLLHGCIDNLLPFFKLLFEASFRDGIVPNGFKHAIVRPLIKKPGADPNVLGNYRPVSNLPILFKSIEKLAANTLHDHLMKYSLYAKFQSAYRANYSTETALLKVHSDIVSAIDVKKSAFLILLDLSSAFDTIDHSILLNRLENRFGVTGVVLRWFESYLSDRTQCVLVDSYESNHVTLTCGVPQGSRLGPVLFTLYTAPLEDILEKHGVNFMLYADDTQLYITCKCPFSVIANLEECIDEIRLWMCDNLLMLNDSKTEVMLFSSCYADRGNTIHPTVDCLRVGESIVQITTSVKNLGVLFDKHLTMKEHIKGICQAASFGLYKIGRIRKFLDQASTEKLVHAFITSKMDYCNSLLLGINDNDLKKLQLIQNAAARIVTRHRKFDHITPILAELHWLPIAKRIEFKVLLLTYKILNGLAPSYLETLLKSYVPKRTLRSGEKYLLDMAFARKTNEGTVFYGKRNFKVMAPILFNKLPASLKVCPTIECFKSRLKTYLFRECFT